MLPCWSRGICPVSTFWSFSESSGKPPVICFLGGDKRSVSQKHKIYPIGKQLTAIEMYYFIILPFNLYYLSIFPVSSGYSWLYSPDFLNKGHLLPLYDDSLTFPYIKKPNFLSLLKVKVKWSRCVTNGNTREKWPLPGHGQHEKISYKPTGVKSPFRCWFTRKP